MMRSKAEFRILRETVGLSQTYLAQLIDVHVMTVKDWENPSKTRWNPNMKAWETLDAYKENLMHTVDQQFTQITQQADTRACLVYFRTQKDYEDYTHSTEYYGVANACTRLLALRLETAGIPVQYVYSDELTSHVQEP